MRRFGGSSSGGGRSGGSRSGGYRSSRSGGYRSAGSSSSSSSTSSSGPSTLFWYGSSSVPGSSSSSYPKGKWKAVERGTPGAKENEYVQNPSGQIQYFRWNRQNKTLGTHLTIDGGYEFGYKIAGYGTSWGTNFNGGAGKYRMKKGFSKKAFGLGVGPGFLGGSALEEAGVLAKYSVYHRYHMFRQMMRTRNPGLYSDWDDEYYTSYYQRSSFYCQAPAGLS